MILQSEIIKSRQNPFVKWAASLQAKKGREEAGCFLAEGEKLAAEAASARLPVTAVVVSESKREKHTSMLLSLFSKNIYDNTRLYVVSDECFCKISSEIAPQGIITIIKYLDFFKNKDIIKNTAVIIPPLNAPHGIAARRLRTAAKPVEKYATITERMASGAVSLSGFSTEIHINVHTNSRIAARSAPMHAPKADAAAIPYEFSEVLVRGRREALDMPLLFIKYPP